MSCLRAASLRRSTLRFSAVLLAAIFVMLFSAATPAARAQAYNVLFNFDAVVKFLSYYSITKVNWGFGQ